MGFGHSECKRVKEGSVAHSFLLSSLHQPCMTEMGLNFLDQIPIMGYTGNSAHLVQMLQNVVSDQSQHCLLTEISMQNTMNVKIFTGNP